MNGCTCEYNYTVSACPHHGQLFAVRRLVERLVKLRDIFAQFGGNQPVVADLNEAITRLEHIA